MRILLVENDALLGDGLQAGLKQEKHIVDWVQDGVIAEQAILNQNFDTIILDIGLPRKSGFEILKSVRDHGINTPIIMLTARDAIEDRVHGLDMGADDYLTKPFELEELLARIRAIERRGSGRSQSQITINGVCIDPKAYTVSHNGTPVSLSRREFDLLANLMRSANKVVTRNHLLDALYNWDNEIDSNALEVHVHHLRKKFGSHFIKTVRGVGYTIQAADTK